MYIVSLCGCVCVCVCVCAAGWGFVSNKGTDVCQAPFCVPGLGHGPASVESSFERDEFPLERDKAGQELAGGWKAVVCAWSGDQDFYRLFLGLPNHAANEPCALCRPE